MSKKYLPIDLPRNMESLMDPFGDDVKKAVHKITKNALSNGRWSEPEDMLIDPSNLEFVAYWIQKTRVPIVKSRKGTGMEAHFDSFRKKEFKWNTPGFIEEKSYRFSFSGDLMFAKYIEESKNRLYDNVEDLIFGADYSYANLESTLSIDTPRQLEVDNLGDTPEINITKNQYDALVKHNQHKYDVVQLANNHIMDCGEEGAKVTMGQLNKDKIAFLGVYESEAESKEVCFTMLGDIKIGWVTHTYSLNGRPLPEGKPWMCNLTEFHGDDKPDTSRIEKQIKSARESGCDLVIVTLHWGLEFEFYPHPDQQKLAYKFAELGADAILGHHPHVCQPYEIYNPQSDSRKSVPIVYSLGNLTPAFSASATVLSLVANITVSKGYLNKVRKTMITGINITPIAFMQEEYDGNNYASLVPLSELKDYELDEDTQSYVNEINEYANLVLGDSWR